MTSAGPGRAAGVLGHVLLLAWLGSLGSASTALAEDDPQESLHRVRAEIEALERKARRAGDRVESLTLEVQRLDRLSVLRRRERAMLEARARDVQEKATTSDERLAGLRAELEVRAAELVRRLQEVRQVGRLGILGAALPRARSEGFLSALRQLSFLVERDHRRLDRVRTRIEDLGRIRADLARTREELRDLQEEARRAESAQRRTRDRKAELLQGVRRERRQSLKLKAELEEAESRLQHMVGGLSVDPDGVPRVPFRLYRGDLPWPVEGRVTQEFGRVGDTRFDIPFPGLDIWAPAGTAVRAVAPGRVVFADWFQGYGKTLCLDHGEGYITVYSHLQEILVRSGARVERGDEVARVGDTGSLKGPHLYFQISRDGTPQDPRRWLRPRR